LISPTLRSIAGCKDRVVTIVPRLIKGNFGDVLFDFVAQGEGLARRVFSDARGVPTIGLGYAMLCDTPGWPPRDSLERDLGSIGIKLTPADRCRLIAVGEALSGCDLARAKRLVEPWSSDENSALRNTFSFMVSRDQAQVLFEMTRPDHEALLRLRLGRIISEELSNSQELVALFSLAYHDPVLIGRQLSRALRSGERERAWYEIRFGCNHERHPLTETRRRNEAEMFGLTNARPSREERLAVARMLETKRLPMAHYLEDTGHSHVEIEATLASLTRMADLRRVA
jgi:hypothetical protein